MFWTKKRKIVIPLQTQFYYIKVGYKGVYNAQTSWCTETGFLLNMYLYNIGIKLVCVCSVCVGGGGVEAGEIEEL